MLRYLLLGLVVGLFAAAGANAQTEVSSTYALEPGDQIDISILEDPTLNRQVLVRPDGKISFPLAGTITAAGRTPEDIQGMIRSRLTKNFVAAPNVTVALVAQGVTEEEAEGLLPAFFVVGEVKVPGRYIFELEKPVSVLQALSVAGGLEVFAARKRIQIRRFADGAESVQIFDYDAVESGASIAEPIMIEDGDVIVVPERGLFN